VETALLAAETGHLVFSTLHTNNAVDSVHRIMDFFQEEQQSHFQLAATLLAVFSQQLVPSTESSRNLVMACEVMLVTPAVQNMIREGKIHQIRNMLTTGSADGMKTMELALKELYDQEKITFESGLAHSFDPSTFRRMCGQDLARNIVVRDTGKSVSDLAPRGSHPSALTGATAGKWV
jgi:twitching motility protein PilT